jgi:hypothetical protein
MRRPGDRLRALASHVFDAETMEHLIDPVVADLQAEYGEASRAGRIWRRRWVRIVGYAAFGSVATRSLRVFGALTLALIALLMVPPMRVQHLTSARALYLVPQALVVAVPISFTFSIAWASQSARASRQSLTLIIGAGVACSVLAFATLAWWMPSANQAFRVSMARELGVPASPARGLAEMTIGELREQMKWATTVHADWPQLEFQFHFRWAFGVVSLALASLMGALGLRGVRRRSMLVAVVPILFAYYVLMYVGRGYALAGTSTAWQPAAGAWMPNAIVLLTAALLSIRTPRLRGTA